MKKIILTSVLTVAAFALFSFASFTVKSLELVNGTKYPISEMWITISSSKSWDYEVEMDKAVAPKGELSIALSDELVKNTFDVIIYDAKSKKYNEYDDFKPSDLKTTWELLGDEVEPGKHGANPTPTK
jgi:hypothetical protein